MNNFLYTFVYSIFKSHNKDKYHDISVNIRLKKLINYFDKRTSRSIISACVQLE